MERRTATGGGQQATTTRGRRTRSHKIGSAEAPLPPLAEDLEKPAVTAAAALVAPAAPAPAPLAGPTSAFVVPLPLLKRADLPEGECLCTYCTARCCRYFALPIETPTTWADFDHMRWYVMHGKTAIFVDGGTWYLLVFADCQHLQPNNMCGIYLDRPQICRDYSTDNCEYDNDGCYDKYFETADQIWEYAEATLPARKVPVPAARQPVRKPAAVRT